MTNISPVYCGTCVMNSSLPGFYKLGNRCSFCEPFIDKLNAIKNNYSSSKAQLIFNIKKSHRRHNCIVGLSGGVDSSYVLHDCCNEGLNPLAVHLDNGWDSEYAQDNINRLISSLGVPLYTHIIDWEVNKSIQRAFLNASVVDIDMCMDNAQAATCFNQASKYKLKYILSGTNTSTEGILMPDGWTHPKFDVLNLRSICRAHGVKSLKTHPLISYYRYYFYTYMKGISWVNYLDLAEYNKDKAIQTLTSTYGYTPYPGKHGESIFTRFYQNYILPVKFGIDKRFPHLSALVASNQLSRSSALEQLSSNPYLSSNLYLIDREYVLNKLDYTEHEFEKIMAQKPVSHFKYNSSLKTISRAKQLTSILRFPK